MHAFSAARSSWLFIINLVMDQLELGLYYMFSHLGVAASPYAWLFILLSMMNELFQTSEYKL